jgi:hypothetical protein
MTLLAVIFLTRAAPDLPDANYAKAANDYFERRHCVLADLCTRFTFANPERQRKASWDAWCLWYAAKDAGLSEWAQQREMSERIYRDFLERMTSLPRPPPEAFPFPPPVYTSPPIPWTPRRTLNGD